MDIRKRIARAGEYVSSTVDLARAGGTERQIAAVVGAAPPVRHTLGWYGNAMRGDAAKPEDRHLAALVAAKQSTERTGVFSHRSAATLLDLPVWSDWMVPSREKSSVEERGPVEAADPLTLHTTTQAPARGSFAPLHVRHRCALDRADVVEIEGFPCTSPERILFDLARTESFEIALACADAWLRRSARVGYEVDERAWESWRMRLLARAGEIPRGHGVVAVRVLAALADPRADSPLESVSRLRLLQLGFEVDPQFRVVSERGTLLHLDFRFRGLNVFGECDGKAKYLDPDLRGERSADEVFAEEKRRHDWVTGTTRMRGVRWGASDVLTAARLGRRLRSFGLTVPARPTLEFGSEAAEFLKRLL